MVFICTRFQRKFVLNQSKREIVKLSLQNGFSTVRQMNANRFTTPGVGETTITSILRLSVYLFVQVNFCPSLNYPEKVVSCFSF